MIFPTMWYVRPAKSCQMAHCWKSHVTAHMDFDARKPEFVACKQQRRRPAWVYNVMHSDQPLCFHTLECLNA